MICGKPLKQVMHGCLKLLTRNFVEMPLTEANKKHAEVFCKHCYWVCINWSMNLAMHKHQPGYVKIYTNKPEGRFLEYYSEMSRLATLLETAKLHDEAKDQRGNESLSIEFFTRYEYRKDADEEWKKVKKISIKSIKKAV